MTEINRLKDAMRAELSKAAVTITDPAEAAARAREHLACAQREALGLADFDEDPKGFARAVCAMHAHIKAADGYLESARGVLPAADFGEDDDAPATATSAAARGFAGTFLAGSGRGDAAARLVGTRPPRRH